MCTGGCKKFLIKLSSEQNVGHIFPLFFRLKTKHNIFKFAKLGLVIFPNKYSAYSSVADTGASTCRAKCCEYRALYFSGYFIMTWVSLSKWNGLVNGLRHFLWLCTSDSYQDLGKEQQDIWIWYIFLCLWGPVVLFQISAVQRGGREREIVRKRQVEGGGEVGLIYEFRVSHL